jgi:hypothetical protein
MRVIRLFGGEECVKCHSINSVLAAGPAVNLFVIFLRK